MPSFSRLAPRSLARNCPPSSAASSNGPRLSISALASIGPSLKTRAQTAIQKTLTWRTTQTSRTLTESARTATVIALCPFPRLFGIRFVCLHCLHSAERVGSLISLNHPLLSLPTRQRERERDGDVSQFRLGRLSQGLCALLDRAHLIAPILTAPSILYTYWGKWAAHQHCGAKGRRPQSATPVCRTAVILGRHTVWSTGIYKTQ